MPLSQSERAAVVDRIVESRFPSGVLNLSGGDEAEESRQNEMRKDATSERARLLALSDDDLESELEFSGAADMGLIAPQQARSAPKGQPSNERLSDGLTTRTKVAASIEKLRSRYGDARPSGVSEKNMLTRLNLDLRSDGKDEVSVETLRRAKKAAWPG